MGGPGSGRRPSDGSEPNFRLSLDREPLGSDSLFDDPYCYFLLDEERAAIQGQVEGVTKSDYTELR